jgi:hypothetical protein
MDKNLFAASPIQNGLKEEEALSPSIFSFASEYAVGSQWRSLMLSKVLAKS